MLALAQLLFIVSTSVRNHPEPPGLQLTMIAILHIKLVAHTSTTTFMELLVLQRIQQQRNQSYQTNHIQFSVLRSVLRSMGGLILQGRGDQKGFQALLQPSQNIVISGREALLNF